MTGKRWPILDLDDGATESDIRRAYARRLRALGPEADVAAFQGLRAEFESALATVRTGGRIRVGPYPPQRRVERPTLLTQEMPHFIDAPKTVECESRAREEIAAFLRDGRLVGACDRFDRARAANELDFAVESEVELELARHWLADTTLDRVVLATIARRYRWTDVGFDFSLGPQIVARLRPAASVPAGGERFVGRWNWGAFLLTPFWLMSNGLPKRGIRILVVCLLSLVVPFVVLGLLAIAVDYGRRGNALAVKHRGFADDAQFVAVQNAWRNWGFCVWTGVPTLLLFSAALLVALDRR